MAIDSEVKRKSIAAIGHRHSGPVVVPSGTISQPDRQVIGYSYSGIAASGAAPVNAVHQLVNNLPLTSLVDSTLVA
jgi:hypothetical protein